MSHSNTIKPNDFEIIISPSKFKIKLLESIREAKHRIYISALYLENDNAGNEILDSLYKAKEINSNIDIKVFVDFHRAQRGLIGSSNQIGNIKGYFEHKKKYKAFVEIYGVPVKTVEILGVFHFKGFVIDDTLIYSGASLNNVYLNFNSRFRLDRYFFINNTALANSFVNFYNRYFLNKNNAVSLFKQKDKVDVKSIRKFIKRFTKEMSGAYFKFSSDVGKNDISVTPVYGMGSKNNELNNSIIELIKSTTTKLTIYTPYFNLPSQLSKEIGYLLKKKSIEIFIIVGDKTANDFYIPTDIPFKKISIIPYLYEQNLKRFIKNNQQYINEGFLNIYLWKNGNNTFHLKGIEVDDKFRLLTGNNLNPRGWSLDMENGILVNDKNKLLKEQFDNEYQYIIKDCIKINSKTDINSIDNYPNKVKKYLMFIYSTKTDKLIKRLM